MKMGEVVEDTKISPHHPQMQSSDVGNNNDHESANNDQDSATRIIREYVKLQLSLISSSSSTSSLPDNSRKGGGGGGDGSVGDSISKSSTELSAPAEPPTQEKNSVGPVHFSELIPDSINRRRKSLLKRYLQALRRLVPKGNLRQQLKGTRQYELKFLEALFVRNVLLQSLPHLPSLVLSNIVSLAGRSSEENKKHGNSSSGGSSSGGDTCINNSNKKLVDVGDDGAGTKNEDRMLCNDDGHSSTVVPKPSAISEYRPYAGPWYNLLRTKAMNERDPNHLLHIAYDKFSTKDASLKSTSWLAKQSKKSSRSPIVPSSEKEQSGGGGGGSSVVANTPSPAPAETTNGGGDTNNSSHPSANSNTVSTPLKSKPVDSSKAESLTKSSYIGSSSVQGVRVETLDSKVVAATAAVSSALMLSQSSQKSQVSKDPTSGDTSSSATGANKNATTTKIPVAAASLSSSASKEQPPVSSPEKGRKATTLINNKKIAVVVENTPSSKAPGSSSVSSNSSELSVKSVISENTDSSSSTSTSVSSISLNESVNSSGRNFQNANNSPVHVTRGVGGGGAAATSGNSNVTGNNNINSNANANSGNASSSSTPQQGSHGNAGRGNRKSMAGPKPPKKYSEKMKAEASVLQRISELQKEGMWWEKRLPKVFEPLRAKSHWDYLLEEMTWMATDFVSERKWKRNAAKKCARMIEKYFHDKEIKRQKAEKEEESRKRRTASAIAKNVRQFWSNVQMVVEFKEQCIIDSMRKKALDQKLSYLVNETEKYSEIVAQTFTAIAKKAGIDEANDESNSSFPSMQPSSVKEDPSSPTVILDDADVEFVPPSDSESDVDDTIAEEEAKEKTDQMNHKDELDDLEAENNMSYDEIVAKYAKYLDDPEAFKEPQPSPVVTKSKPEPIVEVGRMTRRRTMSDRQLRASMREPEKVVESDIETEPEDDSSCTEEESHDEDDAAETEKDDGLASLLKSISTDSTAKTSKEEESNKLANLAESFQPKGYTLSSTTVVTKVPHILRHSLREYQHIGLDWLVAMYDKRLNGILADEMGLGKTIQTIALLAYLAVERVNWGPHLIIVPTSVMLNWEMEFKKWCPGFKILTYYGSQKERKLKRSGWTKPNAFHVCITSYKLVIQDHQSFRRKRWKYLILDEAQNIKNFKSQRWQLLLNFHTQRRLLLTGTPLQNNLMELWSLLHFLMPNVFQSHMEFKDWFSNPMSGMVEGSQEYNEDIVRRLHKVLRPFILRRMKSEVEKQLPQKYEHVVMCSLSKRQRFLYEEFMSRTKTKNTLSQGNLLSVINVLMQLRKVCNHPNLFEPRPIVSPFQSDGITYAVPSVIWDVMRELKEDSFRQRFPLFTVSNPRFSYSEGQAKRIEELTPLFAYNPDEERRYVVMNYEQCGDAAQPPPKRIRRIVNVVKNEPPPCPKLPMSFTYFLSGEKPDKVLEDSEFLDYLKREANKNKPAETKTNESQEATSSSVNNGEKSDKEKVDPSDSEDKEDRTSESDFEEVIEIIVRKRKVAKRKFDIGTRLSVMGYSTPDFELDYIQERTLHDRKQVVDNLNKVNWQRCYVHSFLNQNLVEDCQVIGKLPPLRLTSRRSGGRLSVLHSRKLSQDRDYKRRGYYNLGFNDIMTLIKLRLDNSALIHHPKLLWSMTSYLDSLVRTPESRIIDLMNIIKRFVIYIPAVSAPSVETQMFRPSKSVQYFNHIKHVDSYRETFTKPTYIIHPTQSRMSTQFPDPRLIQYDCGKLQTLDTLLRRLKTENHRVLIFTQMAKVLDILESFLNYHGYIYLRLDGATKIDQRQLLMERFNADKKIFCFILSTRSGGIGVNLTGADTVIFYDSDWNPTMDAQAQDRCHRIGQTRDVHIYRLVSEKTVEENILKKSNQKRLLGELAIEGGKFTTTYFKQHTIRDLFTINEMDDVAKRLNAMEGSSNKANEDEDSSFNPSDLMKSPEKKQEMQMIECALAAAEDDTDVQAAQTVHAEAEAEMAEFDENVSLDALDDVKSAPNKFELEFQQVYDQLTDVERYAIKTMEASIDDWSKETVAQAQKDLEEQKIMWELQQPKIELLPDVEDDNSSIEDILTYSAQDLETQEWVVQLGNFEQDMYFPIYAPPTPPRDEMDVYFDMTHGYLYDYAVMSEDQLPPVYVPKHPKKQATPVSPITKPEKTPEPVKDTSTEALDVDSDSPTKKSPKVGSRREDPLFAPKSIFDRPSPAMAKMRRDLRLQRYSCRPASIPPKTLGPGSVTFPITTSTGTQKTPPPPTPADAPEWLHTEDNSLLQTTRSNLELPLNLFPVNLGQTPNWDFAQHNVNAAGFSHRTWKQCKWRYENVVGPREEGKLLFDPSSASDPGSPSSGKKKKQKAFIKITPPSPSKQARNLKTAQLVAQDNNAQVKQVFVSKYDTIKSIANKRSPTNKGCIFAPQPKSNRQAQELAEMGIDWDNPLPATTIAQSRYERIQLERKKMELARQQQAAAQAASVSGAATTQMVVPSSIINAAGNAAIAAAIANTRSPPRPRAELSSISVPGNVAPLVLQSTSPELIHRDIPSIIAQQRSRQAEIAHVHQQQQVLLQRQSLAQAQSLTSLLNQPQALSQAGVPQSQQQPTTVTVLSNTTAVANTQSPQTVRATAPIQVHQSSQGNNPTVVLPTGLAQALAASVGSSINVSSSTVTTSAPLTSSTSTTTVIPTVARPMQTTVASQPQIQRVPTITMQDLVSSATGAQRFQTGNIITTSASSVQTGSQAQQAQPTLVSLTPMLGSGNQQIATKLIQNPQGLATLVQPSPTRSAAPTISQQAASKLNPLQLQYLKQTALIRQTNPVSTNAQQQQVQQIKDQLINAQQIKRIQVVAAPTPATIVSSATGSQPPPPPVSLPPVSSIITTSASFASLTGGVATTTAPPVVTISSSGTTPKVSLSQPHVTIMHCAGSSNVIPQSPVLQQQPQRQVQLVKQHTVGGKTVTRPVSDAEVAAFLKQHGMSINHPSHTTIPVTKTTPVATYHGSVPVQGQPTLLTVGLQNIMKVHQSPTGQSVATLVKSPGGQAGQSTAGQALTFPVHVSKVGTKGTTQTATVISSPKQGTSQTLPVQQVMIRRQGPDPTSTPVQQQSQVPPIVAASASSAQPGKITHMTTQVPPPGTMPTHVVVQTAQKQLPNTIAVQQLQQVFKQVGATGLQQQIIGKPTAVSGSAPNTITVTTSSTALTIPPSSATSTATSLVHIPSNIVGAAAAAGSSPIHARIVPVSVNLGSPQSGVVKQTIQVVSGPPPNTTLIGTSPLAVRPTATPNPTPPTTSVNHTIQLKLPPSIPPPDENI